MALPINIEDLLNKRKVEDNRIEFKRGWNPDDIYHSISAFANDIDNLGGGYILVGVDQDEDGVAIPVHTSIGKPISNTNEVKGKCSDPRNDPRNDLRNAMPSLTKRQSDILKVLQEHPDLTRAILAEKMGLSDSTIKREIKVLTDNHLLKHEGSTKKGKWIVLVI